LTGLRVTGLQVRGYIFRLSWAFRLLEEGPVVCPPRIESTFCATYCFGCRSP